MTSEDPQVEILLRRIADGDRAAFASLYDATSAAVYGLLARMLQSPATAEEVAQDVYLEIWDRAVSFDARRGGGLAWIMMRARSRALDRLRSDSSYAGALDRAGTVVGVSELAGDGPDDPEQATSLGERRALVRGALEEMPEAQRTAVLLSFFGGLTHPEIAEREGIPLGTVKSRIRAGLEKVEANLRHVLGGAGRDR
ncbi:MAG: sigma-70 family RNA polymerase sigma factor [Gemmatimonadales bacterium]